MTKKKLLAPLFIAASFLLIGCSADTIVGRPAWINQDILVGEDDYKDNKMKDIYDAIKALGDTNSNVLNKVMYQVAQNQLGHFEDWTDAKGNAHLGLKTVAKDGATDDQIKQFVEEYPVYKSEDKGYKKGAEDLQDLTDAEKIAVSRAKIKAQYDSIINRVCELMYNEVKDGSYTTDGVNKLFSEEEYVRHLKKELYHPDSTSIGYFGKQVFTPKPIGMTWKEFVNTTDNTAPTNKNGYLHIMDTSGNLTKLYYPDEKDPIHPEDADKVTHGYIGRKILPDVYRELLIENYVREQRYTNLGRGYARKVEMVKISYSDAYRTPISAMLNNYAKTYIAGDGKVNGKAIDGDFEWLNQAMIGIAIDNSKAKELLTAGEFNTITIKNGNVDVPIIWQMSIDKNGEPAGGGARDNILTNIYYGTKLGDLVEKYMKAFDLSYVTPTVAHPTNFDVKRKFTEEAITAYNELTNNGVYPVEVGVELKERELLSNDITQDGWFMKSGGLTDITDKFRNQLFSINTSMVVDDEDKMKEDTNYPGWGDYESGDSARYFINNDGDKSAYVVRSTVKEDEAWKSVVLEDESSKNFFIIKVNEAASLAKLSPEDDRSYLRLKADDIVTTSNIEMDKAVRDIVKPVASGDTYKKNAEQYYLMISNILFYDQSVYDYFKSQFPELFK